MIKLNIKRGMGLDWEVEKWRKRYFLQSVFLFGFMLVLAGVSFYYIKYDILLLAILGGVGFVIYLMIYELYNEIQNRAKSIILIKNKELFGDVSFVYNDGIDGEDLEKISYISNVVERESFDGIKGNNWSIFEEVILGKINDNLKNITKCVFDGILVVLEKDGYKGKAEISLNGGELVFERGYDKTYDNYEFRIFLLRLMKFFKASKVWCEENDGKIYIGVWTREKIFSSFSLLKTNRLDGFNNRVLAIIDIMNKF